MSQQYQQPGYPQGQAIPLQQQPQMSAVPTPAPAASTPYVVYPAGNNATNNVVKTEPWQYAVRGIQIVISIVVLGLSAYIIHGAYMDPFGFAIAVSVLTWLGLGFILASGAVTSLQTSWRIFVVIAIDAFLTIMWLSAMGSTAHMRAAFKYRVSISGCYDDGSLIGSMTCYTKMKRDSFVSGKAGLASMTSVACLSALNFILFAVMTVLNVLAFLRSRNTNAPAAPAAPIVDGGEKQQTVVPQPAYGQPAAAAPVYATQGAAIPAAVPVQQPIQPQYTGGFVQQPIQPQYTGDTYGQQPIPTQHTGGNFTSPTPPPPQGFYEAPGSQPFTPQYTGNYPSPTATPAPVQAYAQELPTQHAVSPPNSPPPHQGYTHHQ